MMIIPKTLRVKIVIRNHITMVAGGVGLCCFVLTLFLSVFVVHPFFKLPFGIIMCLTIWAMLFASRWNKEVTRGEFYLKFLMCNRENQYDLQKKDVIKSVRYYKEEVADRDKRKETKPNGKRSY